MNFKVIVSAIVRSLVVILLIGVSCMKIFHIDSTVGFLRDVPMTSLVATPLTYLLIGLGFLFAVLIGLGYKIRYASGLVVLWEVITISVYVYAHVVLGFGDSAYKSVSLLGGFVGVVFIAGLVAMLCVYVGARPYEAWTLDGVISQRLFDRAVDRERARQEKLINQYHKKQAKTKK